MRRVLPWFWVLAIALGQMHGLAWLSHHQADPAHCLARFTDAGCHTAAHQHDDQPAAAHAHRCHSHPAPQHEDRPDPTDPQHTSDCPVCHAIASAQGTPLFSPTTVPLHAVAGERLVMADERSPIEAIARTHFVRGPPHA